jgi:hypothetical protein
MSTTSKSRRPFLRITFSRIPNLDDKGNDVFSRPKQVGAIRARNDGETGGLVSLNLIPVELAQR